MPCPPASSAPAPPLVHAASLPELAVEGGANSLTKMSGWRSQRHLVLLNSLTCGLEICVAAGITHGPPLLLEAGVQERYMTMVLGIGPVLGLLFIPLIGSASDRCSSRFGRRRPFIWLLSLGVLLSLLIIPHADVLAARLGRGGRPLQVGLLILGVGLLDFCGQVCFTPLEALLSDLYGEEEACGQAFAMFSFMVSLGGCVGYLLPALDWSRGVLSTYLGGQEESLFAVLILIFILSVLVTTKVSVEELQPRHAALAPGPPEAVGCLPRSCCPPRSCWPLGRCRSRPPRAGPLLCLLRMCRSVTPTAYRGYCQVPAVMQRLCAAQLCGWMAVMSFVLFYTDFVGEGLYEGVPSAAPGTPSRQRYDDGIRMGSLGLFLQCATSTAFSLAMSRLVRRFGCRRVYLGGLASFTASALVICLSKSVALVTAMSALTGFAYATLQTLPYTLTCHYHKEAEIYMPGAKSGRGNKSTATQPAGEEALGCQNPKHDGTNGYLDLGGRECAQPCGPVLGPAQGNRGVGLDFAVLDSTFLLSQVFPTLFMGTVVQLTESVTAYMASSALFGFMAIYFGKHIVFDQRDLRA